jgi:hypothetical protein
MRCGRDALAVFSSWTFLKPGHSLFPGFPEMILYFYDKFPSMAKAGTSQFLPLAIKDITY